MVLVEFIKDFATKKKGDTAEYDGGLASVLVSKKVAKKRLRKTNKEA